jgi:hypothetical protein
MPCSDQVTAGFCIFTAAEKSGGFSPVILVPVLTSLFPELNFSQRRKRYRIKTDVESKMKQKKRFV